MKINYFGKKLARKLRTFFREVADYGFVSAVQLGIDRLSWKWNPKTGARGTSHIHTRNFPHPIFYRRHTSDAWAIEMVLTNREYAEITLARPARLVVDCGANIGCASLYFLTQYPDAHVVAIEPDPDNFAMCQRNLAPFADRVTLIRAAVWSEDTDLQIVRGEFLSGWEWAHTVQPVNAGTEGEVRGMRMETLFDQLPAGRVDALKIDIEGAEKNLFSTDCGPWIHRVDNMFVELHDKEAEEIFDRAMAKFTFERTLCGELTACLNIRTFNAEATIE